MSDEPFVLHPRRNRSRKVRRPRSPTPPPRPPSPPLCWERFEEEGEELYTHMVEKFDTLFDGPSKIKHFDLRDQAIYDIGRDHLKETEFEAIEAALIPWLRAEHASGRLFHRDDWKPFRDSYCLTTMFLGYRRLFRYKNHYFQLAMDFYCELDDCKHCEGLSEEGYESHLALDYCGWVEEEDGSRILKPWTRHKEPVPDDDRMPEWLWKIM